MTKTKEQIKTSFDQNDLEKHEDLNVDELKKALESLGLNATDKLLEDYLNLTFIGNRKCLNLNQYELLVHFLESPLRGSDDVLFHLSTLVTSVNSLFSQKNGLYSEGCKTSVIVKDDSTNKPKISHLSFLSGVVPFNQRLADVLRKPVESDFALVFDFKLKNGSNAFKSIEKEVNELKSVISSVSNEAKLIIDNVHLKTLETDQGLQIIVDISSVPLVKVVREQISDSVNNWTQHPINFNVDVRSASDLSNPTLTLLQLTNDQFEIELNTLNLSTSDALKDDTLKRHFKKVVDDKSWLSPLSVLLLAIKEMSISVQLNSKVKEEMGVQLGLHSCKCSQDELIQDAIKFLSDNSIYEFIDLFENLKNIIRSLNENENNRSFFGLKIGQLYFGIDVQLKLWHLISKTLKLE